MTERSDREFTLAEACRRCGASAGAPCVIRSPSPRREFHVRRYERALARMRALHLECVHSADRAAANDGVTWEHAYKECALDRGIGARFRPDLWAETG